LRTSPHVEQLRAQTTAATGGQGCAHVVVGDQRAGDVTLVEIRRAQLHVAAVGLQPIVVVGCRAAAAHVHRPGLATKLPLREEHVGTVGDLEDSAIVSGSVIVTKSMPRRLASS
jgi:hypothetical protein